MAGSAGRPWRGNWPVGQSQPRGPARAAISCWSPIGAGCMDLSSFFKELKGQFAQWYNRRHERYGVLWAERFKSVLLEGGQAVAAVGAYIELNPVRAGLCAYLGLSFNRSS